MMIKSKIFIQKDAKQFEVWNFRVSIIIEFKIKMRNSFIFGMKNYHISFINVNGEFISL